MRPVVLGALAVALAGCFHYSEEWTLGENGEGTVVIRCRPAGGWLTPASTTQWLAGVRLFMPPYHALSQSCSRVGMTVDYCRVATEAGVPRIELKLAFPTLAYAARCPLFIDRHLQWRANRYTATLLYGVPALPAQFTGAPLFAGEQSTLRLGTFDLRVNMPGRVTEVQGAQRRGSLVTLSLPFDAFVASNGVAITATTRVRVPWWYWGAGAAVVLVASVLIVLWYFRTRMAYADSNRNTFYC